MCRSLALLNGILTALEVSLPEYLDYGQLAAVASERLQQHADDLSSSSSAQDANWDESAEPSLVTTEAAGQAAQLLDVSLACCALRGRSDAERPCHAAAGGVRAVRGGAIAAAAAAPPPGSHSGEEPQPGPAQRLCSDCRQPAAVPDLTCWAPAAAGVCR